MRRFGLLILTLMSIVMVLSACGDDLSTDDAEKAVRAVFEGDVDEANKYICDDEKLTPELAQSPEGLEIKSISCEKDGDDMKCDYSISIPVEGSDPVEISDTLTIAVEDGKLCGNVLPETGTQ